MDFKVEVQYDAEELRGTVTLLVNDDESPVSGEEMEADFFINEDEGYIRFRDTYYGQTTCLIFEHEGITEEEEAEALIAIKALRAFCLPTWRDVLEA